MLRVRRAARSLFPSLEYRYWGFYTDCGGEPAELDLIMRAHAHVENHIARLKDSGLCRFPFSSFAATANWMAIVMLGADLVRWFQLLCCDGYWSLARPKALRWGLFHAPGRIVRTGRRILSTGRRIAARLPPHRSHHLSASRPRAPDEPGPVTPTGQTTPALSAKWSTPGLLTYGNRPANPSTDLNRESKPSLNDPRERSGLGRALWGERRTVVLRFCSCSTLSFGPRNLSSRVSP